MTRKHTPKGAVVPAKEKKFDEILLHLPESFTIEEAEAKFREIFPGDWQRIEKRYMKHERIAKPAKGHPMPPPKKWFSNTFGQYAKKHGKTVL
jgi:hypothetical protein